MTLVMGIDPGSRSTGYGLISHERNSVNYVASGCIQTQNANFPDRLRTIHESINRLISEFAVDESAIEEVFVAKNPQSALKLGQARGAAIVAVTAHDIPIHEYAARYIKKTVVGTGSASKDQVQFMVKKLLNLDGSLNRDASDALAIALCHVFSRPAYDQQISRQAR